MPNQGGPFGFGFFTNLGPRDDNDDNGNENGNGNRSGNNPGGGTDRDVMLLLSAVRDNTKELQEVLGRAMGESRRFQNLDRETVERDLDALLVNSDDVMTSVNQAQEKARNVFALLEEIERQLM